MKSLLSSATLLLVGSQGAAAIFPAHVPFPPRIHLDSSLLAYPPSGSGVFTQPIDHKDPSIGNFTQRYWFNSSLWGGPGYPVRREARPNRQSKSHTSRLWCFPPARSPLTGMAAL
jgi:hypothetical protein